MEVGGSGRAAVEQLLYLMDQAFEGDGSHAHSLISNLREVSEDDWRWAPTGGKRTIAGIVEHIAWAKHMYADYAFGPGTLDGRSLRPPASHAGLSTMSETIAWLREGQATLRGYVAELDDAELVKLRKANWGEMFETRWLIAVTIEHDLYHGGEINHIRALRQGNDTWAYE